MCIVPPLSSLYNHPHAELPPSLTTLVHTGTHSLFPWKQNPGPFMTGCFSKTTTNVPTCQSETIDVWYINNGLFLVYNNTTFIFTEGSRHRDFEIYSVKDACFLSQNLIGLDMYIFVSLQCFAVTLTKSVVITDCYEPHRYKP